MEVAAKLMGKSATFTVGDTVGELHAAMCTAFELDASSCLRILHKGKKLSDEAADAHNLTVGAKLMVMLTKAAEKTQVESAQPERMRGFEDDDERVRSGAVGGPVAVAAFKTRKVTNKYRFNGIRAMSTLPPGVPPSSAVEELLRDLSTDPAIVHIMQEHRLHDNK